LRKNASRTANPAGCRGACHDERRSGGVSVDRSGEVSDSFSPLASRTKVKAAHNSLQNPHSVKSAIVLPVEILGFDGDNPPHRAK
jgi:hypothetical protein